jgi:predicted phage terminase large subunit-like protein
MSTITLPRMPSEADWRSLPTELYEEALSIAEALAIQDSREDCTKSLAEFHSQAWPWIDPAPYASNWHLDAIAEHLQAVTFGQITRLLITMPPRCSKSSIVCVTWPAWTWLQARNPEFPLAGPQVQWLFASYAQTLSERDALKMRRLIASDWFQARWKLDIKCDKDTVRKYETGAGGYRLATSVGGSLTGEGGDLLCIAEGELVATPRGGIRIEHIRAGDMVYAFDHQWERVHIKTVTRAASRLRRGRITLHTTEGLSLRCSFDHPVYEAQRGYVAASELREGDRIIHVREQPLNPCASPLRTMPKAVQPQSLRGEEGIGAGEHKFHVLSELPSDPSQRAMAASMFAVRQEKTRPRQAVLFPSLCRSHGLRKALSAVRRDLRRVWREISDISHALSTAILQPLLCGYGPLQGYDRLRQFSIQPRHGASEPYSEDASINFGTGRAQMCGVSLSRTDAALRNPNSAVAAYASFGREPAAQLAGKSRDALWVVPQDTPSWTFGAIARIERDCEAEYKAYDLSVAGSRNFFAGGILVHNCVDDPINAKEANYATIRQAALTWWDEAMSTRLNNQAFGAKVVVMQRLHEDDLAGHILDSGENWDVLSLPMEYDGDWRPPTSIGWKDSRTEEGELLWPARFPAEAVERLKRELGPFAAASQLAQTPAPRGGGIILRDWWQVWPPTPDVYDGDPERFPPLSFVLLSVDTAYGEKEENDWNACTAWGIWQDKKDRPQTIMLEAWRKRCPLRGRVLTRAERETMSEQEVKQTWGLVEWILDSARRRKADCILIEDKSRGIDLAAEVRKLLRPGEMSVHLIVPKGDKSARLMAVEPMFADGMVWAPNKTWADWIITETTQFPKGKFDDGVDTLSQALNFMRQRNLLTLAYEADEDNFRALQFVPKPEARYDV